jgi:hypothetical protein
MATGLQASEMEKSEKKGSQDRGPVESGLF